VGGNGQEASPPVSTTTQTIVSGTSRTPHPFHEEGMAPQRIVEIDGSSDASLILEEADGVERLRKLVNNIVRLYGCTPSFSARP
jgi:hypothetical protein